MFLESEQKDSLFDFNGLQQFSLNFKIAEYFTHYPQYKLALEKFDVLYKEPLHEVTTKESTLTGFKKWPGIHLGNIC